MLSLKTRLECTHSFATEDSPDLHCDYDGKCDGKLYECCLYDRDYADSMALVYENEKVGEKRG